MDTLMGKKLLRTNILYSLKAVPTKFLLITKKNTFTMGKPGDNTLTKLISPVKTNWYHGPIDLKH